MTEPWHYLSRLPEANVTDAAELPRAWWHGCWLEPGHYLFDRHGHTGRRAELCRLRPTGSIYEAPGLDGGLAPRRAPARAVLSLAIVPADRVVFTRMAGDDREACRRIESRSDEAAQGEFLLHGIDGYTIAAWWDRTQGDTRGACNSCLIVEGGHSANEMIELFPRLFPKQAARLDAAGVSLRFLRWA
jgi:hypothetical protein